MIAAVAGIGEFAIKCGGPPIATRMQGAKFVNSKYDQEKSVFRLDYETHPVPVSGAVQTPSSTDSSNPPSTGRQSPLSEVDHGSTSQERTPLATPFGLPSVGDDGTSLFSGLSTVSPASASSSPLMVECELRCDLDTWASSLDIIVDPAPSNLTCLKRHKLASGGGGLWLTVEHDAAKVTEDRITVVVRRGPTSSKDKGAVLVNGVKTRVDVEDLPDHEVKNLAKKKRIKPTRIPLDQPPVLTVARRRGTELEDGTSPVLPTAAASWTGLVAPVGKWFSFAADQVVSTAVSTSLLNPEAPDALSDSRPPIHAAFEALSRVRELASQSVSDGWTVVSEKNLPVYRKFDPRISSKIAIHRGQSVIEGYGAEDIAAVISNSASRIQWDDRIDSITPLDSYGAGCKTGFVVAKAGFPFRDRGFYVATLTARVASDDLRGAPKPRVRTMSMTNQDGRGRSPPPNPRPSSIVCVTASYATSTPRGYSTQKVNPFALPIGQILLEGWVLDTLDPYTSENLAIPSTRCTLITAIDLAGSVPLGYTLSHNANNARSLAVLERYLKGRAPSPNTILPSPMLVIDDTEDVDLSRSDGQLFSWQLNETDKDRVLLSGSFTPDDNTYQATINIKASSTSSPTAQYPSPPSPPQDPPDSPPSQPSTPSRTSSSRPSTPAREIDNPVGARSSNFRSISRASGVFPSSRSRTLSTSASFSPSQLLRQDTRNSDLIVGEIVIDASLYKSGCKIWATSRILPSDSDSANLTPNVEKDLTVPLIYAVQPLASSTLTSNSLSSSAKRYVLIITIPTAQYGIPSLKDPLTGKNVDPPPKPVWLTSLEQKGGIVDIVIKPAGERSFSVFNGDTKVYPVTAKPTGLRGFIVPPDHLWADDWPRLQR